MQMHLSPFLPDALQSAQADRRRLLQAAGALALSTALPAVQVQAQTVGTKLPRLVLAGPPAIVSAPLMHMAHTQALAAVAEQTEFVQWRDPDQLRVMALGKGGDAAHILAMPSNVAANLYNRGAPVRLLNIAIWGALWVISRDVQRQSLADLRGEEIAVPFRGDMPDIVLQVLAKQQGIDPRRDWKLRYVPSPIEAMQLLITRRVRHALLVEPAVSMALRKTQSFPVGLIAPELHRAVDLQQEWGRVFGRAPQIPQAGIAAVGELRQQADVLAAVQAAYAQSLAWCQAQPQECGALVAQQIDMLTPEAVADAIATSQMQAQPLAQVQEPLRFFFEQLWANNPALLGGKLPDAAFFAG